MQPRTAVKEITCLYHGSSSQNKAETSKKKHKQTHKQLHVYGLHGRPQVNLRLRKLFTKGEVNSGGYWWIFKGE